MSRPRLLLAAVLSLAQAALVERSCTASLNRSGARDMNELQRALRSDQWRRLDLAAAPRLESGNLLLEVPAAWLDGPRASLLPLVVFADARPVPWLTDPPDAEPQQTLAWLGSLKRRARVLVLHCVEPCREAWVARDDSALRRALAWARVRDAPLDAAPRAALVAAFAGVAFSLARSVHSGRALLAFAGSAALMLAAFRAAEPSDTPLRTAGPLLVLALVGFGPALLAAAASRARATLSPAAERLERGLAPISGTPLARAAAWAAPCAAALLWLPLAWTDTAYYTDWANHLYYTARQADALRELHRPSYFLNSTISGPLYPYFSFYGGSLYVVAGVLSLLLGSVRAGYVAVFAISFACAYGGLLWLTRLAGVRGTAAHLPALTFVSSAYYLTNAYGRGSWAETAATSMLPMVIATGAALLFGPQARPSHAVVFLLAAGLLTGSHTITLVWGTLFLALTAVTLAALFGTALLLERRRRLLLLGELFTLAVGLNAWFLLPALAYGGATHIGGYSARGFGSDAEFLNTAANLLHPGRAVPPESSTPALYTQLPVYPLLWAVCAAVATLRARNHVLRRALVVCIAVFGAYLLLLVSGRHDLPWLLLPRVMKAIQFQFRLHTYVNLSLAALLVIGLAHAARSPLRRAGTLGLGAAVTLQLTLAGFQIAHSPHAYSIEALERAGTSNPGTLDAAHDYRFVNHPDAVSLGESVLPEPSAEVRLDPAAVRHERLELELPAGGPFVSNLPWSPFVESSGDVAILGRTSDGWAVLASRGDSRRGVIQPASPLPVRLGRLASALSAVGAVLALYRVATTSGSRPPEPPAPRG